MILYSLVCGDGHSFEGWFASSDSFAEQRQAGQVTCAVCGSAQVGKALMAPSVATSRRREPPASRTEAAAGKANPAEPDPAQPHAAGPEKAKAAAHIGKPEELVGLLRRLRQHVTANAENVGPRFPEEARRIHYGETEKRGIFGEASPDEARALVEEGVDIHPLPLLPEDRN